MKLHRFNPPRSIFEYGFDKAGVIMDGEMPRVGWDGLDAHARSFATGSPCEYVVTGEIVRDDGARFPELAVNPDYLRHLGYAFDGRRWTR